MKGATTEEGKEDTAKRAGEMEEFKKYKVHVLYQTNAWFDGYVASKLYVRKCLKEDIDRIADNMDKEVVKSEKRAAELQATAAGSPHKVAAANAALEKAAHEAEEAKFFREAKKLMLADNLGSQRAKEFCEECEEINVMPAYGPRNGTDVWQPVDHGIGHEYHVRVGRKYDCWTKTDEAQAHFKAKTYPDAPRRRLLMVQWVHAVYEDLERERTEKELQGEHSIFHLAFLRTGVLVSANGDEEIDKEIRPEGMTAAIKKLKGSDKYYSDHKVEQFRDLLKCKGGECGHVQPRPPLPPLATALLNADTERVAERFKELEGSDDIRAQFIVKCLQNHIKWAGSSFIIFMGGGVATLLAFLGESKVDGTPAHDIDLYRKSKKTQKLGARFSGMKVWKFEGLAKKRAVEAFRLTERKPPAGQRPKLLDVDEVNLFKGSISPSTDLWPNLCAGVDENGALIVENMFPNKGPPIEITCHNALDFGKGNVDCYVLRKAAMPIYNDAGALEEDANSCDGRFRSKLHARKSKGVNLHQFWEPGPFVPSAETYTAKKRTHEDDAAVEAPDEAAAELSAEDEESDSDSDDLAAIAPRFQSAIVIPTSFDNAGEERDFRLARQIQQQDGLVSAPKPQKRAAPRPNPSKRSRRKGTGVSYVGQG